MDYFNYLPIKLIEIIFEKLNLNDLIKLRIVNKRFKLICEQIKIKQLIVNDWSDSRLWFYTNDIANLNEDNLTTINQIINYQSIFQLDKNLKRLFLNVDFSLDVSLLDRFASLEQISIDGSHLSNNFILNLANLKIADIFLISEFKITLNTPNLVAFKSPNRLSKNFIFNYPSKILNYETHQEYNDNDNIKIFTNLEHLRLEEIDRIDINILSKFKKLKILELVLTKRMNKRFDQLKRDINYLIDLKENLNSNNLEIYLQGVELINQNKIHELKWQCDWNEIDVNILEFQLKNYDLLKDNSNLSNSINYCDLIKYINKIPSCLNKKYPDIFEVSAHSHIDDEDQFIKYLNSLLYLSGLYLINCDLSKSFYDKLINFVYLYNLNELSIDEKINLEINFEFILNLNQLKQFKTNQEINNVDLIHKLLIKNKKIKDLEFSLKMNKIKIKTIYLENEITGYQLHDNSENIFEYNLNDLILKLKIM